MISEETESIESSVILKQLKTSELTVDFYLFVFLDFILISLNNGEVHDLHEQKHLKRPSINLHLF